MSHRAGKCQSEDKVESKCPNAQSLTLMLPQQGERNWVSLAKYFEKR